MTAIFFDLETTDLLCCGQILNYCFIQVDDDFNPTAELNGQIKISRLQLPGAGAVLANRVNVLDHQDESELSEADAMHEIWSFIDKALKQARGSLPLIGYNSSRFDIPYLRTSMMRNGISPYFTGKILNRDLYHVVKKLATTHKKFPRLAGDKQESDGKAAKLSLKLETISGALGILSGKQTHFSRDDVLLTIELARALERDFDLDVRTYEAYEVSELHDKKNIGQVFYRLSPGRKLSDKAISKSTPMTLLDFGPKSSLWVNLESYGKKKKDKCINWHSMASRPFILSDESCNDGKLIKLARQAIEEFKEVKLSNYFDQSSCDIEMDIYRLHSRGFVPIDALNFIDNSIACPSQQ